MRSHAHQVLRCLLQPARSRQVAITNAGKPLALPCLQQMHTHADQSTTRTLQQTLLGDGGTSARWTGTAWSRLAALASAAAISTAVLCSPTTLLCEAAAPGRNLEASAEEARSLLNAKFDELQQEAARLDAQLPAGLEASVGAPPSVKVEGDTLQVLMPLRLGANVNAVQNEIMATFGAAASATEMSTTVYGQGARTTRLRITPITSARQPIPPVLTIELYVPPANSDEPGHVRFLKKVPLSLGELTGLSRVLEVANVLTEDGLHGRGGVFGQGRLRHGGHNPIFGDLESAFDEFERVGRLFGGGIGAMHRVLQEWQRAVDDNLDGNGVLLDVEDGEEDGGWARLPRGGDGGYASSADDEFPQQQAQSNPQTRRRQAKAVNPGVVDGHDWGSAAAAQAVKQLQALGAQVTPPGTNEQLDWQYLAGYETQKRTIEDTVLMPLLHAEVYENLAKATRKVFQSNRPRAVLFDGPPGTGKTTSARIISSQAAIPMVYLPIEALMSKWFGESEKELAKVFRAAEALGGCILFLDELDALGGSRDRDMHEASRRILSVLLREMEGFAAGGANRTIVVGATNRKRDLDAALLSRFDLIVEFDLPDKACRQLILQQYAAQLSQKDLADLAERTPQMSGRDLRDVCEHTERRWASKIIRGEKPHGSLPSIEEYQASAAERLKAILDTRPPKLFNLT